MLRPGRPARGDQLPLARGPDREAVHGRGGEGLHLPARLPDLRLWQGARAAAPDAQAGAARPPRELDHNPRPPRRGCAWRSRPKCRRLPRGAVARKQRRAAAVAPAARSRAPFAGGVAWIVLVGVLLAGIVAVNVLVLQLNMQFDGLSRERAQLKADNALLRSQLSSASASVRIEDAAKSKLGLQAADPLTTTLRPARQVRRKSSGRQANHRIRLLLTAFAFVFVDRARPRGLAAGRPARSPRGDGDHPAPRDDRGPGRARHDLRPHRRAARDRRAGDDRLRRPAEHRRRAARRDRRRQGARPRRRTSSIPR